MRSAQEQAQHIRDLRGAFREVFGTAAKRSRAQEMVLEELARVGHALETTFDADARAHAFKEGRRDFWLRINLFLNMSDRDLKRLSGASDD